MTGNTTKHRRSLVMHVTPNQLAPKMTVLVFSGNHLAQGEFLSWLETRCCHCHWSIKSFLYILIERLTGNGLYNFPQEIEIIITLKLFMWSAQGTRSEERRV